jgi:predicted MPP superfamily phosphohydrolase
MNRLTLILVLATTCDLLIAAGALHAAARWESKRTGQYRISLTHVVAAVFTAGFAFCMKAALAVVAGMRLFGLMRLIWWDLALMVPVLCGGLLLLAVLRRRAGKANTLTPAVALSAVAGLAIAPLAAYASFVEPYRLVVERAEVPAPQLAAGQTVTVAVLADLQFNRVTAHEHAAVDLALAADPDLIVLPGDLFQGARDQFNAELPQIRELLSRLHAHGGVYIVAGNVDVPERIRRAVAGTSIRFLENEIAEIEVDGMRMAVAGLTDDFTTPAARACLDRLTVHARDRAFALLLSHRPDTVLSLNTDHAVDLLVSGHTHGGQVALPWFGPPVTLSQAPRRVCAGGLHRVGGQRIYVSRGVGCERGHAPRIRFNCPPEVSVLTLRSPG